MHKRYSVFYFIGSMSSALAGILAYGLMQMQGLANLSGWRWIFIMEGAITCLIAVAGWFLIVNFPDSGTTSWKFLSKRETQLIIARVNADRGDANTEPFDLKKFFGAALDLKIWGFAIIFGMCTTGTSSLVPHISFSPRKTITNSSSQSPTPSPTSSPSSSAAAWASPSPKPNASSRPPTPPQA